jgi:hypothetical protein|tara:strand:+ start:417 stop:965 length:549 start_codon:yes stop_codon:yes gene_type:complete
MNISNFIETYKIPNDICENFIKYHKRNKEYKKPGVMGDKGLVDKKRKDSIDVTFYNETKEKFILKFFNLLSNAVKLYGKKYQITSPLHTYMSHNIQHYKKNGGYFLQHYERFNLHTIGRELVYMLYCNNVKNGGTFFPFQQKRLECNKGNLIIWPAHFTHPHYGVISKENEKYIVTGWFEIR